MYWYNGQLINSTEISLAIADPGLLYGATVFTTLRIYGQTLDHPLTAWTHHCHRLNRSLDVFGWAKPNWSQVRQGAETLKSQFPVLRLTLFSDGREWITGRALPSQLGQWQAQGLAVWVAPFPNYQRWSPEHKTGNYLGAWLAREQAQHHQAQEAILTNAQGHWLETSTGNLWAWGQNRWWTPPLGDILPSIVREQLGQWLRSGPDPVEEAPWSPERVHQFEAIAHCNSVVQALPIIQIVNTSHRYPANHPALEALERFFNDTP